MRLTNVLVTALILGLVSNACTLGGEDGLDSVYETAFITVIDSSGVADGRTPLTVTVTGAVGVELSLEVMGQGASFAAAGVGNPQEKAIYLEAQADGTGTATVGVLASEPGIVSVALKADRVRTARELDFQPVRIAIGTGTPMRLEPGLVVHEVCVAVNSANGILRADAFDVPGSENLSAPGSFSPVSLPVRADMPAGAECPSESVDAFGWLGYAVFSWATHVDSGTVTMSYLGPDDSTLATELLPLDGAPFAGYSVDNNRAHGQRIVDVY